jgi:alpha-beta hydrolase superfamily lysophospholipase
VADYQRIPYLVVHTLGAGARDVYGTIGAEQVVLQVQHLRGATDSDTAVVAMHPIGSPGYLPMFSGLARTGCHVIAAATRYTNGDQALVMENVVRDLGAVVRDARERLGYRRIVLAGWSGGGSLMLYYQRQAEQPDADLEPDGLIPADGVALLAAHRSRHHLLTDWLDPSVVDEVDPTRRDPELNLYDPANPNQPPYSDEFLTRYRAAQVDRNRRITAWAEAQASSGNRAFVVHGTMADPRWLDPSIESNDRRPRWCYLGDPAEANDGPAGLARFTTVRSWLSQWSLDRARADGVASAARISVPALIIRNSADDACPVSHTDDIFAAIPHTRKDYAVIKGANHYYSGPDQREPLAEATSLVTDWIEKL